MAVRADLDALAGYHSPQVHADVRLNTNESPFDPPAAWLAEYLDAVAGLAWNRYPDRRATALRAAIAGFHGVPSEHVFAANGSNEVIQSLLLAYAGPGRTVVVFEPTYQLHRHIARITGATVVAGDRRDDFTIDPSSAAGLLDRHRRSRDVSVLAEQPHRASIESPAILDVVLANHRGSCRRRRGLRRVLVVVGTRPGHRRRPTRRRADVLQDVEHGGRSPRVCRGPHVGGRLSSKEWSCRTTSTPPNSSPACWRYVMSRDAEPSQRPGRGARPLAAGLADLHTAGVEAFASGANFILMRFHRHGAQEIWRRLLDAGVLVRDCSGWPGLDGCLRVTIGRRPENDRLLAALGEAVVTPDHRVASVGERA